MGIYSQVIMDTLNSINAKLDEVLAEIVAYHDLRVAEEDR